jgi:hypothetical protein
MLIFANGKAIFTGAKEARDVKWALYQIYPVLSRKSIFTEVRVYADHEQSSLCADIRVRHTLL